MEEVMMGVSVVFSRSYQRHQSLATFESHSLNVG